MKHIIIILLLLGCGSGVIGQDLFFEVRGIYDHSIKETILKTATSLEDMIPFYPKNWITSYDSVTIICTKNGKVQKSVGPNEQLTAAQIAILRAATIESEIEIFVNYKYRQYENSILEAKEMHVIRTVVAVKEAQFVGGYEKLKDFIYDGGVGKYSQKSMHNGQIVKIGFTVNEKGAVTNVKLLTSSGNRAMDRKMLKLIETMPLWNPAQLSTGEFVKQDFVFKLGNDGC